MVYCQDCFFQFQYLVFNSVKSASLLKLVKPNFAAIAIITQIIISYLFELLTEATASVVCSSSALDDLSSLNVHCMTSSPLLSYRPVHQRHPDSGMLHSSPVVTYVENTPGVSYLSPATGPIDAGAERYPPKNPADDGFGSQQQLGLIAGHLKRGLHPVGLQPRLGLGGAAGDFLRGEIVDSSGLSVKVEPKQGSITYTAMHDQFRSSNGIISGSSLPVSYVSFNDLAPSSSPSSASASLVEGYVAGCHLANYGELLPSASKASIAL